LTGFTSQALNNSHEKERRKRCVLRRLRKTGRDDADVTWRGRSFQATGKALSPTVDSLVWRSMPIVGGSDPETPAPAPWCTGERAPTFTNGWAWGTVSWKTANKKLT